MAIQFDHLILAVNERAKTFFCEVLGLEAG